MDVDIAFTGVPVSELAIGRDFFERLFGRSADVIVNDDEVMWCLADSAWLYVVVDPRRAGQALAALRVGDLDATLAELAGRGITARTVEEVGDAGRKATVPDPDGNSIALIEVAG
jgi:predicted enzyme related to lactoylglutathione lyase